MSQETDLAALVLARLILAAGRIEISENEMKNDDLLGKQIVVDFDEDEQIWIFRVEDVDDNQE